MSEPLLVLTDVAGVRGGRVLFEALDLALAPGAAVQVGGANGAGKSTLLRITAGLLPPAAGGVTARAGRAWLGEATALDGDRPLAAALGFWAGLAGGDADARVAAALSATGLSELAEVPVRYLSTGQRRRAAFARVIADAAPIWLLDEPASGLDVAATTRLEAAIARHRDTGGAVMVATHQPLTLPGAVQVAL